MSDGAAILSLLTLLTFSPCEGFLPVYLSGITYGWLGFALLSAVLAVATLAGMVLFTWLSLLGLQRIRLGALERFEGAILGGLLCVLGVAIMVFER
jgi:nickel/cobalt exporter